MDKSFSTYAPGDDSYRENWERTFGKPSNPLQAEPLTKDTGESLPNASPAPMNRCPYVIHDRAGGDVRCQRLSCHSGECDFLEDPATPTPSKAECLGCCLRDDDIGRLRGELAELRERVTFLNDQANRAIQAWHDLKDQCAAPSSGKEKSPDSEEPGPSSWEPDDPAVLDCGCDAIHGCRYTRR